MELIDYSKALNIISLKFNFDDPPFNAIEFSRDIVRYMYDKNAITISAPQVGKFYDIIVLRGSPENFVCFNPRIVMSSDEQIVLEESSLSYPGLIVKIKRPRHIKVRFATPNSEVRTETFTGMTARAFQHSMDFLKGEEFYRKANLYHRSLALSKWKKQQKK
jgi:peptide deformylase